MLPIIGITADHHQKRHRVAITYANSVRIGGGLPIIIPPILGLESHFLSICDGFVFSGGDDPNMEPWGIQTDSRATPVSIERQDFEISLLKELQKNKEKPVLGVCLGMQWMGLLAGGILEQDLPEQLAANHKQNNHNIYGSIGEGLVHSHHHQAMKEVGSLEIIATSDDGLIEAIRDPHRYWYIGVQWHPELTEDKQLGQGLFNQLIQASLEMQETHS